MASIKLPKANVRNEQETLNDVTSLVIVGPNGSGKSRLAEWIRHRTDEHPVSLLVRAERALALSGNLVTAGPHGFVEPRLAKPFDFAMSALYDELSDQSISFRQAKLENPDAAIAAPETKFDKTVEIWAKIMPQRRLVRQGRTLVAQTTDGVQYPVGQMSDGERVALFLIAQCLNAEPNSLVVVDEPEIHLHPSIQRLLWDGIEAARADCCFAYITHDLAFAAGRTLATKIWMKSFDGADVWDWQKISSTDFLPEELQLQILGSRQPVLFVESEYGKIDHLVYTALFPDRLVVPRRSCTDVINSTKALRGLPELHRTDAKGVIDRDNHTEEAIAAYRNAGVSTLDTAEVENLLLLPDVLKAVSAQLHRNPEADLESAKSFLFDLLQKELEVQVNERATWQVQQRLNSYPGPGDNRSDKAAFGASVASFVGTVDASEIYDASRNLFEKILAERDYDLLLRHYNRKTAVTGVARHLGLQNDEYPKLAVRLLQAKEGEPLRQAVRSRVPGV